MDEPAYLRRMLEPALEGALTSFPVVVLTGARQTGKTTLVRHLASAKRRTFRTLDDLNVLDLASREPDTLVAQDAPLTLDEVQRAPDLLRAVKRAVDAQRTPGRFLLTGSANLLLLATVSETLAGRAVYLHLGPLSLRERAGSTRPCVWTDLLAADDLEAAGARVESQPPARTPWQEAVLTGGYPPALTLESTARARWFDGYVATYVERDLQQIASISSLADFRRLLALASARVGGLLNRADLARDAALSRPTAHRWIDLLQISFQLRLLPAFAANPSQRIVKAPKLYWTDTGLAAHLAGLATPSDVDQDLRGGAWLENLILCDLDAWRETLAPRPEVYHWRTVDKTEVDLVLEHRRRLLPIEVKAAASVTGRDAAGLERFLATHRRARFGIVAYGGNEVHTLSARVLAVPVRRLLG